MGEEEEITQSPNGDATTHTARSIGEKAYRTSPDPTPAQLKAGNYRKGKFTLHGLPISIENPRGSFRKWKNEKTGEKGHSLLTAHYGYIRGVGTDRDGDPVDIFIGENPESERFFVVDQLHPDDGTFDEHKIVAGVNSEQEAKELYLSNYQKGWNGLGAITEFDLDGLKKFLSNRSSLQRPVNRNIPVASKPETDDNGDGIAGRPSESQSGRVRSSHTMKRRMLCRDCGNSYIATVDAAGCAVECDDCHSKNTSLSEDCVIGSSEIVWADGDALNSDIVRAFIAYDEKWTSAKRHAHPRSLFGDPEHEAFPIENQLDLTHAAMLLHHAKDPSGVKKRLKRIAKQLGLKQPKAWKKSAMDAIPCPDCATALKDCNDDSGFCPKCRAMKSAKADSGPKGTCPDCDAKGKWDKDAGNCENCGSLTPPVGVATDSESDDPEAFPIAICPDCGLPRPLNQNLDRCWNCRSVQDPIQPNTDWGRVTSVRKDGDIFAPMTQCPNCGRPTMIYKSDIVPCWNCGKTPTEGLFTSQGALGDEAVTFTWGDSVEITVSDAFAIAENEFEILADSESTAKSDSDGIMQVRHVGTIAGKLNLNDRLYPESSMQDCIDCADGARERAKSGVMLSEYRHPTVVKADGEDKYVDNPTEKTARVDDISDVQPDGKVYVTRTIMNTPRGRQVAQAYRDGKAGTSVRWKMTGRHATAKIDGKQRTFFVADKMNWLNIDDVDNPAVPETMTDYQVLTDSLRKEIASSALFADSIVRNSVNSANSANNGTIETATDRRGLNNSSGLTRGDNTMSAEEIKKALTKYRLGVAARDSRDDVAKARKKVVKAIYAAADSGVDVDSFTDQLAKVDETATLAGYNPERPGQPVTLGRETGTPGMKGMNADADPDLGTPPGADQEPGHMGVPPIKSKESGTIRDDNLLEWAKKKMAEEQKAAADAEMRAKVDAKIKALSPSILKGLSDDEKKFILSAVEKIATTEDQVESVMNAQVDAYAALSARHRLTARGYQAQNTNGVAIGNTVDNPSSPMVTDNGVRNISEREPAYMQGAYQILASIDDWRRVTEGHDPRSREVLRLREHNMNHFIRPLLDQIAQQKHKCASLEEWFARDDALFKTGSEAAMADAITRGGMVAMTDAATSTATLYNQPTILSALLIQSFWDLEMLQWVDGYGPGLNNGSGGWDPNALMSGGSIGTTFRIPVMSYTGPTGYGTGPFPQYDAGLRVPENTGIPNGSVAIYWLEFAPTWRRIATVATRDVIKALGNGPLNLSVIGQLLYQINFDKNRRIDKAMADTMLQSADETFAVQVTNEVANLPNNSVYQAAGSVTVNLNPAKTASAAVSATDAVVTYGTNVVAAIRLKGPGNGTSSPYFGSSAGVVPAVRYNTQTTLSNNGAPSTTFTNMPTFSTPASGAVIGYIDNNGNIQNDVIVNGLNATANFAVDWLNGVVIFTSGFPSLAGSSSVITAPAITLSYKYVTNYDNVTYSAASIPTGTDPAVWYNNVLQQLDQTGAIMAGLNKYVKPNLSLMSLSVAANVLQAYKWYQLASPKGTELFPTEQYFGEHNGLMMARHNTPWYAGDSRILVLRDRSTKYAVDTPFEIRGPYPSYDSNQQVIAADIYYGEENSWIGTPQVVDINGSVLNPVSRSIILR